MNGPGQASRPGAVLLTIIIVVAVLRVAQDVVIPLALAILLTFLLAPLVTRLQNWQVNRLLAVIVSMTIALGLIGGLVTFVLNQFGDVARQLPSYERQLHENLTHLRGAVRGGVAETTHAVEELTRELQRVAPSATVPSGVAKVQVVEPPVTPVEILKEFVGPLIKPVGTAIVVIVLVAFMLLRLADLRDRVISLLGAHNLQATTEALSDAAQRVSRYLLVQLLINGWTGLWVALGLWILHVPNAGLWGALTLVLRFIPYVGVWTAAAMPFALSFAVFDDLTRPLAIVGLVALIELLNYAVFEPWLYGSRTGVSPVALLLSAAFWTWLWGGVGLFLAIPLTVCLVVMGKYVPQLEFLQVLLGTDPVLQPHQRLYQRLLASNRDEADALLESELGGASMLEVCDAAIVPAMLLVEAEYARGALEEGRRNRVLEHVSEWIEERLDALSRPPSPPPIGTQGRPSKVESGALGSPIVFSTYTSNPADEVVAKLLLYVLLERGRGAALARPEVLERGMVADHDRRGRIFVISALPPDATTRARSACRNLRSRDPDAAVIAGLWTFEGDLARARQRLEGVGAMRTVVSFAACLAVLDSLSGSMPLHDTQQLKGRAAPVT